MEDLVYDILVRALNRYYQRVGSWVELARDSGLSAANIARIAKGQVKKPSMDTWQSLHSARPKEIPPPYTAVDSNGRRLHLGTYKSWEYLDAYINSQKSKSSPEVEELLSKAREVLESKNLPLVEALTNNINAFHEVVMPAQQITTEQAFDIVAAKLVFFCSNPACGKEVGSFAARDKLSDMCPFCGEVTNAKTYAEQIAALRIHLDESDDPEEIYRKAISQDRAPGPGKSKNSSHG